MKEFILSYNEKLKNDRDIKERKIDLMEDYRDRITFTVHSKVYSLLSMSPSLNVSPPLFTLDSEDLEYLYNKYSKIMEKEEEEELKKILAEEQVEKAFVTIGL